MLKPTFPAKLLCTSSLHRGFSVLHLQTAASHLTITHLHRLTPSPPDPPPPRSPHHAATNHLTLLTRPDSTSLLSATRRLCSLCLHRRTMSRQRGRKIQGGAAATAAANKGCYVGYFGRWVNGFDGWMWWIGSPGW
ncbi:hypothetical protein Drorol1_Dr00012176 [Drosera rotundifolia]